MAVATEQDLQKILVVDDEPDGLEAVASRLERYRSYQVYRAAGSDEALALAADVDLDLVVTDVRMPGRDGIDMLVEMQRLSPDVASIIITGYADDEAPLRALRVGAREFLYKPVSPQQLLATVDRLLEQVRTRRRASHVHARIERDGTRFEQIGRVVQEVAQAWARCRATSWPLVLLPLAKRLVAAPEAALLLVRADRGVLRPLPGSCVEHDDIPADQGYVGEAVGSDEPTWVHPPQSPPGLAFETAHQSLLAVPLSDGGRVLAVLALFDCESEPNQADVDLLRRCGGLMARVGAFHTFADPALAEAIRLAPPVAATADAPADVPTDAVPEPARADAPDADRNRPAMDALSRIAGHGPRAMAHAADLLTWFASVLEQQTGGHERP